MVAHQLRARGLSDERVLEAMQAVPRHAFVPPDKISVAYSDEALPIGEGQTISQPFIVAASVEALSLRGQERVLEIGAGCGYQAAVLSRLAREVIAVEAQPALAFSARERLASLDYTNVHIREGDGSPGLPASAPFDAIVVSAAAPAIPPPLLEQLMGGGRLVIPVGSPEHQELVCVVKTDGRTVQRSLCACRFVPLLGRYGFPEASQKAAGG